MAAVFPSLAEYVPDTRDRPVGLSADEFLPKHLQESIRAGFPHPQPEMSEREGMTIISRAHRSLSAVLTHRKKNLHIVLAMWSSKDGRRALEYAIHRADGPAVLVDVLNIIAMKP